MPSSATSAICGILLLWSALVSGADVASLHAVRDADFSWCESKAGTLRAPCGRVSDLVDIAVTPLGRGVVVVSEDEPHPASQEVMRIPRDISLHSDSPAVVAFAELLVRGSEERWGYGRVVPGEEDRAASLRFKPKHASRLNWAASVLALACDLAIVSSHATTLPDGVTTTLPPSYLRAFVPADVSIASRWDGATPVEVDAGGAATTAVYPQHSELDRRARAYAASLALDTEATFLALPSALAAIAEEAAVESGRTLSDVAWLAARRAQAAANACPLPGFFPKSWSQASTATALASPPPGDATSGKLTHDLYHRAEAVLRSRAVPDHVTLGRRDAVAAPHRWALVPFVDLFNFDPRVAGCNASAPRSLTQGTGTTTGAASLMVTSQHFVVKAREEVAPRSEIVLDVGCKSNTDFALQFGFVIPGNPTTTVQLVPPDDLEPRAQRAIRRLELDSPEFKVVIGDGVESLPLGLLAAARYDGCGGEARQLFLSGACDE